MKKDFLQTLNNIEEKCNFCNIEDYQELIKLILNIFINEEQDEEIIYALKQIIEKSLNNSNNNHHRKMQKDTSTIYNLFNEIPLEEEVNAVRSRSNMTDIQKDLFSLRILYPVITEPNYSGLPKVKDFK